MRGPKPTPTYLKLLRGNPGKRRLNKGEVLPARAPEAPEPPEWLGEHAKAEWKRIAPELWALRLLTTVDLTLFAGYCVA